MFAQQRLLPYFPIKLLAYARSTFPLLKQEVQTYIFLELGLPATLHLTDLMLALHILLVFL